MEMDGNQIQTAYEPQLLNDKTYLPIDCEITKQNGSFNVTIKEAKADKNLPISENARMSWEKVKTFLSDEEMDQMDYVIFRTDGLGLEKPLKVIDDGSVAAGRNETIVLEEYKDYPRDVQMIIKDAMESLEDGETYRQSEDMKGKKLIIDYLDVLNEKGTAYTDIDLVHAAALMKFDGEIAKEQIDQTAKFPEGATSFEKNTYFYDKNSITYQFADQFYREIYSYYTDLPYSFDFYSRYPNEFVCEEAAKDIMSDMAYSFAEFVIRDGVVNLGGVMGQKIEFFNDFPEYVKIREELRKKIMS